MSVRLVTEPEVTDALKDMRYSLTADHDGLLFYQHPEIPSGPVVVDFSKGPIPYDLLLTSLDIQGINVDAFCTYLDD